MSFPTNLSQLASVWKLHFFFCFEFRQFRKQKLDEPNFGDTLTKLVLKFPHSFNNFFEIDIKRAQIFAQNIDREQFKPYFTKSYCSYSFSFRSFFIVFATSELFGSFERGFFMCLSLRIEFRIAEMLLTDLSVDLSIFKSIMV